MVEAIIAAALLFGLIAGWASGRQHSSVKLFHRSVRFQDQLRETLDLEN